MAHSYGTSNYPITLKTTIVKTADLYEKTVEKVYNTTPDGVAVGTVTPDGKVTNVSQEPYGGGLTKQIVTYSKRNPDVTTPATTYEENTSYTELPIQQHPKWESDLKADWDADKGEFKPTSPYYGMTSYIVGTTTVTKTEYSTSMPSSDYTDIGSRKSPGGGFGGQNKWLLIGSSRRKVNEDLYAKENTYLYSAKGWSPVIYD